MTVAPAPEDIERRWLPRITTGTRRAVAWFLNRLRPQVREAARAAAAGRPLPVFTDVPDAQDFGNELYTDLEPALSEVFDEAFWQSIDDLGAPDTAPPAPPVMPGVTPAPPPPDGPSRAEQLAPSEEQLRRDYLASVHDRLSSSMWAPDTYDAIRATLTQSVTDGWTLKETTAALRPLMDPDGTAYASWIERVAVTELHAAYNAGTQAAAVAEQELFGTQTRLRWIATKDARTRPTHRKANGQVVRAGEPFTVGNAHLLFPGDPLGPPGETIRCRCSLAVEHITLTASTGDTMTRYRTRRTAAGTTETPRPCSCTAASEPPSGEAAPQAGDEPSQDESSASWDGLNVTITIGETTWEVAYTTDEFTFTAVNGPEEGATGTVTLDDATADGEGEFTFRWTEEDGTTVKEELDLGKGTAEAEVTSPDGEVTEQKGTATLTDAPTPAEKESAEEEGVQVAAALDAVRSVASLTAASLAVADAWTPPAAHFKPYEGPKRGIHVTDDGRVAGYLATWDGEVGQANCHVGIKSSCEPPPRSADGLYRYFHQAGTPLTLDDGSKVHPGLLTTDIGHGNQTRNQAARVAHYDQPQAMAAAVIAGEDEAGIWVSGSVLPEVASDADRMTRLRLARFSGHWEPIGGRMELIAATGVNVPGYPNPSPTGASVAASAAPGAGDVAGEVIRRLDARTLHTQMTERGNDMRARRARSLVAAVMAFPRRRPSPRRAAAETAEGTEDGESHGAELSADDIAFIADLLGLDTTEDIAPVELSAEQVADLLALLDEEESPAGDDVQDVDNVTAANWVEQTGGLPVYIKRIADALQREQGFTESRAIATAVNQAKRWCAGGGDVKPDTMVKACAAVTAWERKRAQARAT
jgi:hypothetical protein